MDYLKNKVGHMVVLAMISFALLVSLQADRRPDAIDNEDDRVTSAAVSPKQDLSIEAPSQLIRPVRKSFQADREMGTPTRQSKPSVASPSGFSNVQNELVLADLPTLKLNSHDNLNIDNRVAEEIQPEESTDTRAFPAPQIQPPFSTHNLPAPTESHQVTDWVPSGSSPMAPSGL